MLLGFIERDEEYIKILLPEIQHSLAFARNTDPEWRPMPKPCKNLVAGIRTVKRQSRWKPNVKLTFEHFRLAFQNNGKQ